MRTFPLRRFLGATAALGGVFAAAGGSPYLARHASLDIERAAGAIAHEEDHITAVELAEWIRDRKPGLRVIDLRIAPRSSRRISSSSERVSIESLPATPFRHDDTVVLISGPAAERRAGGGSFSRRSGYRHVYFLRAGLGEWLDDVMSPTLGTGAPPAARVAFRARARSAAISAAHPA